MFLISFITIHIYLYIFNNLLFFAFSDVHYGPTELKMTTITYTSGSPATTQICMNTEITAEGKILLSISHSPEDQKEYEGDIDSDTTCANFEAPMPGPNGRNVNYVIGWKDSDDKVVKEIASFDFKSKSVTPQCLVISIVINIRFVREHL